MLLPKVYINSWLPSYESNRGKNWISYKDLLYDKYNDWKYESFKLCCENNDDIDEELDSELDEVLEDFLETTSVDLYYTKMLNLIK
jgi:hypothetical protein